MSVRIFAPSELTVEAAKVAIKSPFFGEFRLVKIKNLPQVLSVKTTAVIVTKKDSLSPVSVYLIGLKGPIGGSAVRVGGYFKDSEWVPLTTGSYQGSADPWKGLFVGEALVIVGAIDRSANGSIPGVWKSNVFTPLPMPTVRVAAPNLMRKLPTTANFGSSQTALVTLA